MIDSDRLNHIIGVARLMKDKAEKVGLDKEEMFTLGMLHDIGYEFGKNNDHNFVGFKILDKQNYKYAKEVLYHGCPNCEYQSLALDLLNFADMHIDKTGIYVSFDERLKDIKSRRGENSMAYINSKKIIEELVNKKFLINIVQM